MSDLKPVETGLAKRFDLDQFKSLYYLLNAKPDSQLRLLKESKIISFDCIAELNEKVQHKLHTETLETTITTVTVVFKNKRVITFNNWLEFSRYQWTISDQTLSISISWDINIKLPHHELPQRHTLKLRLGSPIRPNEVFHLMMSSDKDDELLEATANGVCKVDFISTVIANELLQIIDDWYAALENNVDESKLVRFAEANKKNLAIAMDTIISLVSILVAYKYGIIKISPMPEIEIERYSQFLSIIAVGVGIVFVGSLAGKLAGNKVFTSIAKFRAYSMFRLTNGDRNCIAETAKKNERIKNSILIQFSVSIAAGITCIFLDHFFKS